ncbi:MAG: large-conductance mechanosensitive channel protein MscL [Flavobacteriaceae bacterium]|nr:large-conductance mechanosensitive channel protein MscL [Flavobacteriaceae bacterium]
MKLLKDFKDFAVKGNMIDMAVGIIIGASFNAIVNVLVKNIILPPLSLLSDSTSFGEKKIVLREASSTATQVSIDYGLLIETVLDFLIVGFTIFIVVKFINKLKNQANDLEDQSVPTPVDIELLSKIKDLLEAQNEALIKK